MPEHRDIKDPSLTVDVSQWPLVVLTTSGSPTEAELEQHLLEIETEVLGRGQGFVQIIDQRMADSLNALQRSMIAEHQERMDEAYASFCRGEAYVTDAKMKGVMIAVFWQAKPAYPYRFFEHFDEAQAWAERLLRNTYT